MDENELSNRIVGAAIEVHRVLGPGLLESAYRIALAHELRGLGLRVDTEVMVGVRYKDLDVPNAFRLDLMVEGLVIVEAKAIERLMPVHQAQLLTYLRCCNRRLGLLLNFGGFTLKQGIRRVVNRL